MVKRAEHKFCPLCGTKLKESDKHCTKCHYSFDKRHKPRKLRIKNVVLAIIILLVLYGAYRYLLR